MSGKYKYSAEYTDYLQSEEWQKKRKQVINYCNNQCQMCGRINSFKNILQVHHYTYERLGNEDICDLVALCKSCHRKADKERLINPIKKYRFLKDEVTLKTVSIKDSLFGLIDRITENNVEIKNHYLGEYTRVENLQSGYQESQQ